MFMDSKYTVKLGKKKLRTGLKLECKIILRPIIFNSNYSFILYTIFHYSLYPRPILLVLKTPLFLYPFPKVLQIVTVLFLSTVLSFLIFPIFGFYGHRLPFLYRVSDLPFFFRTFLLLYHSLHVTLRTNTIPHLNE